MIDNVNISFVSLFPSKDWEHKGHNWLSYVGPIVIQTVSQCALTHISIIWNILFESWSSLIVHHSYNTFPVSDLERQLFRCLARYIPLIIERADVKTRCLRHRQPTTIQLYSAYLLYQSQWLDLYIKNSLQAHHLGWLIGLCGKNYNKLSTC